MKATQASIRESLSVGKGSLSGRCRGLAGDYSAISGRRPVSVGARGIQQPCNIMVHKAGILDEKAGNCLSLTGKYPGLRIDQTFSAEDDRLQM
jgi:hypothetical protein